MSVVHNAIDEDHAVETITFGGDVRIIRVGLDVAMARARSAYVRGDLEVEAFEAEVERLLRKRSQIPA